MGGFEVGLVCSVEAYPPASITWIHNGIQKSVTDESFSIYKGPGSDGLTTSNLKIKRLQPDQIGSYTCRAGNKLGQAETSFKVEQGWDINCVIGNCDIYSSAPLHLLSLLSVLVAAIIL